jgi:hypothetical protein
MIYTLKRSDYYFPHIARVVGGVLQIDDHVIDYIQNIYGFSGHRGWFVYGLRIKSRNNERGYQIMVIPSIFRFFPGNISIEGVADGLNGFICLFKQQTQPASG